MKNNERVSGMNPRDMTYDEWLAKFDDNNKPKTSDDTFTPPAIYEIVKNYAIKKYGLEGRRVVRPFYPGGDYQNFNYKGRLKKLADYFGVSLDWLFDIKYTRVRYRNE